MKRYSLTKKLCLTALVAFLLSACATTDPDLDGPPLDDSDASISITDEDPGVSVSPISDEQLSVRKMLDQPDSILANRTIYFEFDSARLSEESLSILEAHGAFIAGKGSVDVRLEGHTDERGSREYNIALGDRRAQSVRQVLLLQGASSDQVDTVSYGEEEPAALGHNEEAWAENRRVELIYNVR